MQTGQASTAEQGVDFEQGQLDQAIDHVIATAASTGGLTNYTQVLSAAGLPPTAVETIPGFMAAFHARCAERDLPPLDALVVHAAGPRRDFPEPGYFRTNGHRDPVLETTPMADRRDATVFWLHQIQTCRLWASRTSRA